MMRKILIFFVVIVLVTISSILCFAEGKKGAEEGVKEFPPPPPFESKIYAPEDEGKVKPIDKMPEKPLRIAVLGLESCSFWIGVKEGCLDAKEELKSYNCQVDWIVPGEQHTSDVYNNAIDACIAQEYDAIATLAGDAGVVPFIDKASAAGIPVATFNVEVDKPNSRVFFVGADLYWQGQQAAKTMVEAIGEEGKVGISTGWFSIEGHELRRKGFLDVINKDYPGIEIVGQVEDFDKGELTYQQAMDFMSAHPDLKGIYVTTGGPFGAAKAVMDAGKKGEIWVVCFDLPDENLEWVYKGTIFATLGQDAYAQGHDPAIRLYNYIVGGVVPPAARLYTRCDPVNKDNVLDYYTPKK